MKVRWFFRFFPVPKYLEMPSVGMDISEVSLRFTSLKPRGYGYSLGKFGEYMIPPGTISLGRITNSESFIKTLKQVKKEARLKFVRASLPEAHAYFVDMEIPRVKQKELRASIELQLEEYIPMKVSEIFFDYVVMDDQAKGHSATVHVAIAAIPREIVSEYINAFSAAGLTVLSLEVDADALARAVIPRGSLGTFMIIDMGRVKTGVYIIGNGAIRFASEVDIAGHSILTAIQSGLNVGLEEAAEIKKQCVGEGPLPENLIPVLFPIFSSLREEINRHFIYWHTHHDENGAEHHKIERIILAGSQATLCGLRGYLSAGLRVKVDIANVWENVSPFRDYIPEIGFEDSLRYANAIGLALHSYKYFLPKAEI